MTVSTGPAAPLLPEPSATPGAVGAASPASRIRCRKIRPDDMPALVTLLAKGFPERDERWWRQALDRLWNHAATLAEPAYGFLLDADGAPVGVLLMIYSHATVGGAPAGCNLSSWYVEPAYQAYASLLSAQAMKRREVPYTNLSPVEHSLPLIEAQGFVRYADGRLLALPWLAPRPRGAKVRAFGAEPGLMALGADEAATLARHRDYGCTALQVEADGAAYPFLFRISRLKRFLPVACLIYCRSIDELIRFAGPIGRHFLRRGVPLLSIDTQAPIAGLRGLYRPGRAPHYVKGSPSPRTGNLTDTEIALFGL